MRLFLHLFLLLVAGGFGAPRGAAAEVNYWPFFTGERDSSGDFTQWQAIGPLVFEASVPGADAAGIRPFFVGFEEHRREAGAFHVLYPVFNYRYRPYGTSWDLFTLLRYQSFDRNGEEEPSRGVRLFPIFFWGSDPDPELSYFGVFPIAGSARNFLFWDEATWFLFPLGAELVRGDVTTVAMPWPFIRVVRGPDTAGFHLWPLYGQVEREGVYQNHYWLWPLGYHSQRQLWKEEPFVAHGFLPFYSASRSEDAVSRTWVWPFFGYTDSFNPEYFETRYFWPLLVQRRGDSYINRWAPFYTRSIRRHEDRRWILWPLHRRSIWEERGLRNERTQFFYFLYWAQVQSSVEHPELDPAVKRHVWPLYSSWDNGAGRRQFQTLSPFEVFFPFNEVVRIKYSPLAAIYRMDVEEEVHARHSFLFNFVTTRREFEEEAFALHVGPLFNYESEPEGRQWEFLKGLLSYSRDGDNRSFGAFWLNRPGSLSGRTDDAPDDDPDSISEPASHE